ncbi:hypothetical protein [Capnocytophaga catalasegens]|uniref:Uncharacterized protein n=1 Tax=Capnocytophaga catalasegens TaxID=1004260 RepID=A0AAV5B1D4_9FLAO|nr:hypothetical protein [Capnocytophaga catalasegens]GIZ16593.1 hypothetical protein RCZ03_25930 [Capnocytophaga catalasegens]GJM51607.1 hypothetical protein RCZ15_25800 [Capnocytophaga catalasegens]GJM54237.1 hypothetical protein RCZ16_25530 [Capnocytophaga catalasegens]
MKVLSIILTFASMFCNAQNKELISKVYSKLKKDNKSFEQFVFYGFCNCTDKYLYSEVFENNYITTFNHLEPLPRFFEREVIKGIMDTYHISNQKIFEGIQNVHYNGYLIVSKCYKIYNTSNRKLKKMYISMLSDENLQKQWIDSYMKDYLEYYFIRIQTE